MNRLHTVFAVLFLVAALVAPAVEIDGAIAKGEYGSSQILAKDIFTIHWQVEGDRIHMAIEATSRGWVALGFDPGAVMANADMVFGIVPADKPATAVDAWSTGTFGPHPADASQGGTNDILDFAGARSGESVVFEFTRLLATKDKFDKVIALDKATKLIWAVGSDLAFTARHSKAGAATVNFGGKK